MLSLIIMSFLFAQTACAMSEGADLYLEIGEHSNIENNQHVSSSEQHNEVSEHQDIMSGISHCVHSHPPLTLIFIETGFDQNISKENFFDIVTKEFMSIGHRPPLSPPKA